MASEVTVTKTNYSEVNAMADVDTALGKIDAAAQQRVLNWAASKYQLAQPADGAAQNTLQRSKVQAEEPKDIKSFVAQKRPDGFYERIACLVYHLEKSQGETEISTKKIVQANSDARLSKMTNPSVFIKHTIHTYGYLTSLGKRKFALSARGEAVVDALPERARVDETLVANPFRKKAKKKRGKK